MFVERKQLITEARSEIVPVYYVVTEKDSKTQVVAQQALKYPKDKIDQLKSDLAEYRQNYKLNFIARVFLFLADHYQINKIKRELKARGLVPSASSNSSEAKRKVDFDEETNVRFKDRDILGHLNDETRPRRDKGLPIANRQISPEGIMRAVDACVENEDEFESVLKELAAFAERAKEQGKDYSYQYKAFEGLVYLCCFQRCDLDAFRSCFGSNPRNQDERKRVVLRDLANDISTRAIAVVESKGFSPDNIEDFKTSLKQAIRERNESYSEELTPDQLFQRWKNGNITCLNLPNVEQNIIDAVDGGWKDDASRAFTLKRYTEEQLDSLDAFIDQLLDIEEAKSILGLLDEN